MGAKHVGSLPNGWRGRDRDFAPSPSALSPEGVYILGSLPSGWRGRARDFAPSPPALSPEGEGVYILGSLRNGWRGRDRDFAPSPPALSPEGEGVYILGSLPNGWRGRARDFAPHSRPSPPREREFTFSARFQTDGAAGLVILPLTPDPLPRGSATRSQGRGSSLWLSVV